MARIFVVVRLSIFFYGGSDDEKNNNTIINCENLLLFANKASRIVDLPNLF